ncbi:MAG: sigma 54-interacting transcriptional regulator [Myxococcales bacterium]|nr:sigma 54-interacting transcriptional regulator [Myxococcales bacterium]
MSSRHARLRRVDGTWVIEDSGSRNGSYLEGRRVDRASLVDGSLFELGHTHFMLRSRVVARGLPSGAPDVGEAGSRDPALWTLSHEREATLLRMVEATRACTSILLVGEAGAGKDTLARALHGASGRPGAFIAVYCPLLSGASDAGGLDDLAAGLARDFERAEGGTVLLNEIEELKPPAQLALLSLLRARPQDGRTGLISTVRSHELSPKVPPILADLLGALAGLAVPLPPLREMREDMGNFVARFLARAGASDPGPRLDPAMGRALLLHDWPYNLSELESCIRTALAQATDAGLWWSPSPLVRPHRPAAESRQPAEPGADGRFEHSVEVVTEPEADFALHVRRALKCNLSVAGLQKNGLLQSRRVLESTRGSGAATDTVPALRKLILSAIEALGASSPRGEKQARVLHLTFVKPAATQQEAADALAMAFGTYRRYVTSALAELTSMMWFDELAARRRHESAPPATKSSA